MADSQIHFVEREVGGRMMRFETGRVAKQASGCVIASHGDSVVMCAAMRANPRPGLDFFPLQCDYRERLSAGGRFPGGFRKREGAPNEKEVLTMRMIDRPIRPLFPEGFIDECQIQCWAMSHDGQNDTDVIACSGASAALSLTDAPFEGPVATVRIGRILTDEGSQFIINPTHAQMEYSDLDLVLSGHKDGVNMIEVGAAEVPDEDVIAAIEFGYEHGCKPILEMQEELKAKVGKDPVVNSLNVPSDDVMQEVIAACGDEMDKARRIPGKADRSAAVDALRTKVLDEHFAMPQGVTYDVYKEAEKRAGMAREAFRTFEKKTTRRLIVEEGIRADGRGYEEIRGLDIDTTLFPRTHGSCLFQRGETQSIVTCVLGTAKAEQIVDGLMPEYAKKFYLHYNFPPFCVGEAGRIMGPGRREIGHGALAERSLLGILPDLDDFAYTVRLVSDITESNGSSSMASVCGGCMALMDAGVPIKATCAGISVGRFSSGDKIVHVTDILGEEDFFGDMDFKICGTREGITGIQLDLKARGLWFEEIKSIFAQANKGRIEIIEKMEAHLAAPREEMSPYAPKLVQIKIDPDKIGKLIGPGGKMIRGICERTGASVDVDDDGTVTIASTDQASGAQALAEVEAVAAEIKVGTVYEGKVVSTKDFGAFIEIATGTDGMCHISELDHGYVANVSDVVSIGDVVKVKVINVDPTGRIKLSRKALLEPSDGDDGSKGDQGGSDDKGGGNRRRRDGRKPAEAS
jgi:polyribonucleotide nucleotidyltransferase